MKNNQEKRHKYYLQNRNKILKTAKDNYKENIIKKIKYSREQYKKYKWKYSFWNLRNRCNNPKNKSYKDYGGRGIRCLITIKEVEFLWFRDKAYLMKKPSIDRIDNNGNYCLKNCRFIEHNENINKDRRKPVLQYDLDGNFIKEWESISKAETSIKCHHIADVLSYKRKTAHGFMWRYKE